MGETVVETWALSEIPVPRSSAERCVKQWLHTLQVRCYWRLQRSTVNPYFLPYSLVKWRPLPTSQEEGFRVMYPEFYQRALQSLSMPPSGKYNQSLAGLPRRWEKRFILSDIFDILIKSDKYITELGNILYILYSFISFIYTYIRIGWSKVNKVASQISLLIEGEWGRGNKSFSGGYQDLANPQIHVDEHFWSARK